MRSPLALAAAASFVLSACAGGGPSGPPALAYALPDPPAVTYLTGDTTFMDIDAGGQAMQATVSQNTTFAATFDRAAEGVQVALEVKDLSASITNPMGTTTADEAGITGPLVMTLDRRGVVTIISQPQLTEAASQFYQPLATAHGFFPRLPGRAAVVGESWTDTVRYEGQQGTGKVSAVTVVTYTVEGDSVIDGRSLVKISTKGTGESTASGVITGMDFTQTLTGTSTGFVLWDQGRKLMVESYGETDGRGTMEVSAAPFPLGVRLRGQSRVKLQPGT